MKFFNQDLFFFIGNKKLTILFFLLASVVSVALGAVNFLHAGVDFQWSGAALLFDGINPYSEFISGNIDKRIILSQIPNYAHLLYVVFLPLGAVDFFSAKLIYLAISIICALFLLRLIYIEAKKDFLKALMLMIFVSGLPLRNAIGNGQVALVFCVLLLVAFSYRKNDFLIASILIAIVCTKYSFGIFIIVSLLAIKSYKIAFLVLLWEFFGVLLFCMLTNDWRLDIFWDPLKVASSAMASGCYNLISVVEFFLGYTSKTIMYFSTALGLVLNFSLSRKAADYRVAIAYAILSSLIFTAHLAYDIAFLIVVYIIFYVRNSFLRIIMIAAAIYLCYIEKIVHYFGFYQPFIGFVMLCLVAFVIFRNGSIYIDRR